MATVQFKVVDISADEIADGSENVAMTVAEREKLALIPTGSICAWLIGPSNSSVFNGNINEWAKLGRFDVNAQKNVELINMARNASYWGNGALNAKKLLGV